MGGFLFFRGISGRRGACVDRTCGCAAWSKCASSLNIAILGGSSLCHAGPPRAPPAPLLSPPSAGAGEWPQRHTRLSSPCRHRRAPGTNARTMSLCPSPSNVVPEARAATARRAPSGPSRPGTRPARPPASPRRPAARLPCSRAGETRHQIVHLFRPRAAAPAAAAATRAPPRCHDVRGEVPERLRARASVEHGASSLPGTQNARSPAPAPAARYANLSDGRARWPSRRAAACAARRGRPRRQVGGTHGPGRPRTRCGGSCARLGTASASRPPTCESSNTSSRNLLALPRRLFLDTRGDEVVVAAAQRGGGVRLGEVRPAAAASCALPLARPRHRRVVPSSEDERIAHGSCGRGNETSVTGAAVPGRNRRTRRASRRRDRLLTLPLTETRRGRRHPRTAPGP